VEQRMISGRQELRDAYRDDQVAKEYVERRFQTPLGAFLHNRQAAVLSTVIRDHAIDRAVEIAPGPARLTVETAPQLTHVTVIDASAQMLGEARRRLAARGVLSRVSLVQADAFRLPVRGTVGLVYSFRLIRHFDRAERIQLYKQAAGILRPGGFLVFDAVNAVVSEALRAQYPEEFQHFDALLRRDELVAELREAGFVIDALTGVQHRYRAMLNVQVYVAPRADALARLAIGALDRLGGEPLEWIVTCRRA
jgi:ubiquinone/menaquinone biosynthesis C-methylase UbiE